MPDEQGVVQLEARRSQFSRDELMKPSDAALSFDYAERGSDSHKYS
jgi:hypothetical protein